jgi:predicted transposase YdaD
MIKRNDILWKGIIEDLAEDVVALLLQDHTHLIDFSKTIEFLDKELQEITGNDPLQIQPTQFVDILMKLQLLSGAEKWILLHIEVQAQPDPDFPRRMYEYHTRIENRYHRDVVACAIFIDKNRNYQPAQYHQGFMGTSITYAYNVLKVLALNEDELRASKNPFAVVLLATLIELRREKSDVGSLRLKIEIGRHLYALPISDEKRQCVLNFLRYCIRLSTDEERIFVDEIDQITGKVITMGTQELVIKIVERDARQEGRQEGRQEFLVATLRNSRAAGLAVHQLALILGITEHEVVELMEKHQID